MCIKEFGRQFSCACCCVVGAVVIDDNKNVLCIGPWQLGKVPQLALDDRSLVSARDEHAEAKGGFHEEGVGPGVEPAVEPEGAAGDGGLPVLWRASFAQLRG